MKLCKDCKYFKKTNKNVIKYSTCMKYAIEKPGYFSPIDGSYEPSEIIAVFCDLTRKNINLCGPEAKGFEPK